MTLGEHTTSSTTTVALVTGAASGIGRSIALELSVRGMEVIGGDLDRKSMGDMPLAGTVELDVSNPQSVEAAVSEVGKIDILINNAGIGLWGPIEEVPMDDVQRLFDVNYFGAVRMTHAVLPQMRERRSGVIGNVTSVVAKAPNVLTAHYASVKAALDIFTEGLSYEVDHFGIRVFAVLPGNIATNIGATRKVYGLHGPYARLAEMWIAAVGRMKTNPPETVASVVYQALNDPNRAIRYAGSPDAHEQQEARGTSDDAGYKDWIWSRYQLSW